MRRFFLALLLIIGLVLPTSAQVTLKKQGQDLLMENQYLKLIIQPLRGGVVDSCIDKTTNKELLNKFGNSFGDVGGLGTLRLANQTWPGNEWDRGHFQLVEELVTEKEARVKLVYTAVDDQNLGLKAIKEFILRSGERIITVNLSFVNEGNNGHDFSPWIHNVIATKDTFMVRANGPKQFPVGADYFYEPGRNWIGGINSTGELIYANMDFQNVLRLYFSYWNGFHSLEWVYNAVHLEPGESWSTTFSYAINSGLPRADFVTPELAAGLERNTQNFNLNLLPNKDLGTAVVKAVAVDLKTQKTFELPEQEVQLAVGKKISIPYQNQSGSIKVTAQLYQDGKPMQFGIDIWPVTEIDLYDPITEREEPTAGFEPWAKGIGPYQYIQPRVLEQNLLLKNNEFSIWTGDSLIRYFPQDKVQGSVGDTIKVSAAKAEAESFQIAIRAEKEEFSLVKVVVEPVVDQQGKVVSEVEVNLVDYINTIVPSGFRRSTPIGRYPDPLLLTNTGNIPAGENRVWWVNLRVAPDATAGLYQSQIKIFQGNNLIATFPYELEVYNFQLPAQAELKTDIGLWAERMNQVLPKVGYKGTPQDFYQETLKLFLRNRVSPREKKINWSNPAQGAMEAQRLVQMGMNTITIPSRASNLEEICDELRSRDLLDLAFIYSPYDEAPASRYPEVKKYSDEIHARVPDIKILGTIYGEDPKLLYGAINIWCRMLEKSSFVDERIAAGDEFWNANAPFMHLENEQFVNRNFFWQLPAYRFNGILFWNAVGGYGNDDPWSDPMVAGVNGNAHFIYPHQDGALSSIRWEVFRDGIEDYDYLMLLQKEVERIGECGGDLVAQAEEILSELKLEGFSSKKELYNNREQIARLIEQLQALR